MYHYNAYQNSKFEDTITDKSKLKKRSTLREIIASKAIKSFTTKRGSENVTNR